MAVASAGHIHLQLCIENLSEWGLEVSTSSQVLSQGCHCGLWVASSLTTAPGELLEGGRPGPLGRGEAPLLGLSSISVHVLMSELGVSLKAIGGGPILETSSGMKECGLQAQLSACSLENRQPL